MSFVRRRHPRGFTLLELQVAVVLLAFGVATLGSLMATQARLTKRLNSGFAAGSTVHVTRSPDPWVKKLNTAARLTTAELTLTAPSAVDENNLVTIVTQEADLGDETLSVMVDVTPN